MTENQRGRFGLGEPQGRNAHPIFHAIYLSVSIYSQLYMRAHIYPINCIVPTTFVSVIVLLVLLLLLLTDKRRCTSWRTSRRPESVSGYFGSPSFVYSPNSNIQLFLHVASSFSFVDNIREVNLRTELLFRNPPPPLFSTVSIV